MRCTFGWLVVLLLTSITATLNSVVQGQPVRNNPQVDTPKDVQRGTGINRLGIMTRPSPHKRSTRVAVPPGYYYYGWYPGGYYFANGYYRGGYLCSYCGGRWCRGACGCYGPIIYPPIAADPGAFYGPRAIRQFLGVNGAAGDNNDNSVANPVEVARVQAPDVPAKLSNPTVRARAWKFVEYGDRQFRKGDYRKAAERYRKAKSQAPDIPDIYFRQGFAELGAGRYTKAVIAMQNGLSLKPDWPDSGFVLEELYPTAGAKRAVFRQLHQHLIEHPNDADALFLRAVLQHFDGQTEAAEVAFRRVVELTGVGQHARAFLPVAPEAQDVEKLPKADGPLLP